MKVDFNIKSKLSLLTPFVFPALILLVWWWVSVSNLVNPYLIPSPEEVFEAGRDLFLSGKLYLHTVASLKRALLGFSITALIATLLATILYFIPVMESFLNFPLEFVRTTPPLAAIPLLILWFGIGEGAKLAIIILASFFPIFLNTLDGLKNADANLLEMGKTLDLNRVEVFRFILLPAAIPSVITGLRLGFGYSWRALIGAELVAASSGLGYMILDAEELARTDYVFVGIMLIGGLGFVFDYLFKKATDRIVLFLHLKESFGGADGRY
ncbi:ABC transporter permease [Marinifilum sp. JC120]|nr:ABC transporter permease [Marinifilum sp. JC120]